ncbi:unnamed protein product, partial [Mesorhabditis belari]|uniref:Uncharacterized protein n=1 Tax=Mesorhabditis belari TaxID=2138241 RepID=A0AAF3J3N8_9BILA
MGRELRLGESLGGLRRDGKAEGMEERGAVPSEFHEKSITKWNDRDDSRRVSFLLTAAHLDSAERSSSGAMRSSSGANFDRKKRKERRERTATMRLRYVK